VSVFNVFATLVMPVLGVVALLASGVVEGRYLLMAAIGVLAVGVAMVAFAVVLRSERGARTVGRWADRLLSPLTRRLAHGRSAGLTGKVLDFRSSTQLRWLRNGGRQGSRPSSRAWATASDRVETWSLR
jgi:hypothetical protein